MTQPFPEFDYAQEGEIFIGKVIAPLRQLKVKPRTNHHTEALRGKGKDRTQLT